ncbi:MAG: response regulator [Pseudomonadota bacterium]
MPVHATDSVLIVEEGEVGHQLADYLRPRGFQVRLAASAVDALACLAEEPVAVLLSDTLLPDMNGRELVKQARAQQGPTLAAVLMSSVFTSVRERLDDTDADVVAFLPKPLRLEDVERTLRRVLDRENRAGQDTAVAPAPRQAGLEPRAAARTLLELFTTRRSGVLQFRHEKDEIDVTLLRGVPVNARSNLRQHTLGSYMLAVGRLSVEQVRAVDELMRQRKLRFGEALAELGYATSSETVQFLRGAVLARIAQAVTWNQGALNFVEDERGAENAALTEIDPREAILIGFAHHTDLAEAVAALGTQRDQYVCPTSHLELLRDVVTRVLGDASLTTLVVSTPRLDAVLNAMQAQGATAVRHLYALWASDLIAFLPQPPRAEEPVVPSDAVVQASAPTTGESFEKAEDIFNEYLRCQGAGHYAVLNVDPAAGLTLIEEAARALRAKLEIWAQVRSVTLRARTEEIRGWLEDALAVLGDPDRRVAYDKSLLLVQQAAPAGIQDAEAEAHFRAGMEALARADFNNAIEALRRAHERCPDDPDYAASLGWAESRRARRDASEGYERLVTVCAQNPNAAQAYYYLGLLSEERGNRANAVDALSRAVAVDPYHADAAAALQRLGGQATELYRELFDEPD